MLNTGEEHVCPIRIRGLYKKAHIQDRSPDAFGGLSPALEYTGIHGWHLRCIKYIASDDKRKVIPWVDNRNSDGSFTPFASTATPPKSELPARGERRLMDCHDPRPFTPASARRRGSPKMSVIDRPIVPGLPLQAYRRQLYRHSIRKAESCRNCHASRNYLSSVFDLYRPTALARPCRPVLAYASYAHSMTSLMASGG
jgi:hypothetical protein